MEDLVFLPMIAIKSHSDILDFKNLNISILGIKTIGITDTSSIMILMALADSQ
jgi:hypothetical protein